MKNTPLSRSLLRNEAPFYLLVAGLFLLAAMLHPYPEAAMWLGFAVAGYSAIANDSIQTLGTFISSNQERLTWWMLWLFIGGILVLTHAFGWMHDNGDIAFNLLSKIPQPTSYTFLSLCGPIILLLVTRWRMPVSTTFLILSAFSSGQVIQAMLVKTFVGYVLAFVCALVTWSIIAHIYNKHEFASRSYNKKRWQWFQAGSTAFLWVSWLMQDTANIAVFLPRSLSVEQMVIAIGYLFAVVGIIMYTKGGRIQAVVNEKTDITDLRAATLIDITYAVILVVFKQWNHIPMSTTWVFLGLLAGREIALTMFTLNPKPYKRTLQLVTRDAWRAGLGLLISLLIVVMMR